MEAKPHGRLRRFRTHLWWAMAVPLLRLCQVVQLFRPPWELRVSRRPIRLMAGAMEPVEVSLVEATVHPSKALLTVLLRLNILPHLRPTHQHHQRTHQHRRLIVPLAPLTVPLAQPIRQPLLLTALHPRPTVQHRLHTRRQAQRIVLHLRRIHLHHPPTVPRLQRIHQRLQPTALPPRVIHPHRLLIARRRPPIHPRLRHIRPLRLRTVQHHRPILLLAPPTVRRRQLIVQQAQHIPPQVQHTALLRPLTHQTLARTSRRKRKKWKSKNPAHSLLMEET